MKKCKVLGRKLLKIGMVLAGAWLISAAFRSCEDDVVESEYVEIIADLPEEENDVGGRG